MDSMIGLVCSKCEQAMLVCRRGELEKHIEDAKCSSCGSKRYWRPLNRFEQAMTNLDTVQGD